MHSFLYNKVSKLTQDVFLPACETAQTTCYKRLSGGNPAAVHFFCMLLFCLLSRSWHNLSSLQVSGQTYFWPVKGVLFKLKNISVNQEDKSSS